MSNKPVSLLIQGDRLIDPNMDWVVDIKTFASKGKNNPWVGSVLKGKVMATIAQGKLVYKDDLIKLEVKDALWLKQES